MYTEKIRETARKLLEEKKVDIIIGFRKGSMPMMSEPCIIKDPKDTDQLIWDSFCSLNLANYLTGRTEKIGIFAKGCDSRSIVNHIVEKQIKREQLFIVGIPCSGMIDRRKAKAKIKGEVIKADEQDLKLKLTTADQKESVFEKQDLLQDNCLICVHRNPTIHDELIGQPVAEQENVDRYEDIKKIESMSDGEKRDFFKDLLAPCIRCYACRNACPLCYCPVCFVDEARPQWVAKGVDPADVETFHFLRAYHCAGRCTDCGACESVCPMDIKMRVFTKKLEKDCIEQFGWEPGLSLDSRPALDIWNPADSDEFIK